MTKEDKKLLFRYLSMALPYGVKCNIGLEFPLKLQSISMDMLDGILLDFFLTDIHYQVYLSEVKPYLRPLASMTEEERTEINALIKQNSPSPCGEINLQGMDNLLYSVVISSGFLIDWMLNKHFDIFDLIPKELAIAVTEENNPYNTRKE